MTCSFSMRIWCSKYRNMQYWLSSNHVFIIVPSYNVHHVHQSQSDGMDHQWSQNIILIDIIKMTFVYIICHNTYYYHLSPWYILWCGNTTILIIPKNLIFFHINAIWPEKNGLKILTWLFCCFTLIIDMIFNKHPKVWGFHFTLNLGFFFSLMECPFFDWEVYQGFC